MKYAILILTCLTFLMACESENEEDLFAPPAVVPEPMDTTMMDTTVVTAVSFSRTIAPFFQNNCGISGCHVVNTVRPEMTNYTQIKQQADNGRIRVRALSEMTMPPNGRPRLTTQQKDDLRLWLDDGAPNN